ncbi:MAG TPA: hypothetical protein VGI56_09490 [Galbitalea sp.]
MSISRGIVKIAAGSLPKSLRDRYREQWLADVRDAPEQHLRPAQIALGSVAFALTVGRPLPKRRDLTPAEVDQRVRIARVVALSGAVLGLSQWASMFTGDYLGDYKVPDAPTLVMSTFLIACSVLASVLALVLIFATRGTSTRTRWAVALFAVASASPIVQSSLNSDSNAVSAALHPSAIAYLAAVIPVVVGLALLRTSRRIAGHNPRVSIPAGAVFLLIAAATLVNAMILWSLRAPLRFGAGPLSANNPIYVQWLKQNEQFEALMNNVFIGWGVGAIVLVAGFILFTIARRLSSREIVRLAVGGSALTFIAGGALLGFVQLAEPGVVPLPEISLVLIVGRLALVGAILSAVRAGAVA